MMKKPLVNTLMQILGKAGSVAISLVTTGIITRKLGVEGYGNFILISSMFVFLDSLADFGTKTIGIREVAKNEEENIWGKIFYLRLLMAAAAFIVGLGLVWGWKGFYSVRSEATVALLMIFLTSLGGFWEILFQVRLKMGLKVLADITFPLFFLVWLLTARDTMTLMMVMVVYVIARIVSLLVGYWLAAGIERVEIKRVDREQLKELWRMSWPMGIFLVVFATYDRAVDTMIIQNFRGAKEVAWYGLAYKIYGVLIQPAYFYVNSIFPILSGKSEHKKELFWMSAGILLTIGLGTLIGGWILAPWMVNVLGGAEYTPAVGMLRILGIAWVWSYLGHLFGFTLIANGGQKQMLYLGLMALILNFGLNWWLIPHYGMTAAAWITVLTEFFDMVMMAFFLRKQKHS
jgi:O-antigen/teichoic acid export membrane protein